MLVIKDFATTILASALTAAATSVVVSDASRLPALSAGDYYYLVLQKFTDRTSVEVVKVTGAVGNTLTVVRAQAGTTAKSFAIGDYAEQRVTVGTFSEYIAQSVAGKVDKSDGYVEQSLGLLNTGDLVKATVGISYDAANGHGTILSGGEGANKVTPYVALRPLGVAASSVQLKYAQDGSLVLSGGSRYVETGLLSMRHPQDANGWPNATNNNANNYNNRARGKVHVNNNALYFIADGTFSARRFGIQSGHEDPGYATAYGILDLNPFGGIVRVNGGIVYHTNYAPTPAAVGALALVGGTLTGPLGVRPSVGENPLDLFSTPNPGGTSAQGVAGWDNTGATREWGVGRYAADGVAEFAYFGFGDAPWNSGLRVYGAGDIRAGAANRLYHEGYLPTPDVLGAVPQARTINTKPLTSNVVLSAADVGAVPQARTINSKPLTADITLSAADVGAVAKIGDTMTGNLTAPKVLVSGAQGAEGNALTRKDYVDAELAKKLNLAGGTLTGNLTAPAVLVSSAQNTSVNALTRKDYVDSAIAAGDALQVSKTGDTMTGVLVVAANAQIGAGANGAFGSPPITGLLNSFIEVATPNNAEHNSAGGIVFHNRGTSTSALYYKNDNSDVGYFNFKSDDSTYDVRVNGNKVYHQGFKPTAADVGALSTITGGGVSGAITATNFRPTATVGGGGGLAAGNGDGAGLTTNNIRIETWYGFGIWCTQGTPQYSHSFDSRTGGLYARGNGDFNDVYIRSDSRMKSGLVKVDNALARVSKITAYSYNKHKSISDHEIVGREVGIVAQELQAVLPEAVNTAEDTTLTISNSAVTALLVEAIKELKAEIDQLRRLINGT